MLMITMYKQGVSEWQARVPSWIARILFGFSLGGWGSTKSHGDAEAPRALGTCENAMEIEPECDKEAIERWKSDFYLGLTHITRDS